MAEMDPDSISSLLDLPPPSQQSESLNSASSDDIASEGSSGTDDEEGESDAEREWQDSLKQLEMLLSLVVVPFIGKWLGRRCSFWIWTKIMERKYPVEIVMTSKAAFDVGGLVAAASPL